MKTLAAVLHDTDAPLRLETLEVPPPGSGQVLVDVAFSGVCHTQLHEVRGRKGPDRFLPHTLGHEGSGTVVEVGPGVTKVKPGDRVVLTWIKGQGADVPSATYQGPAGRVNSGAISTFMRRTLVSENRVVRVPDGMPLREAALLGCAVPTGAGMVLNDLKIPPGSSVAVFGVGGIGLSAVLAANLVNALPIVAVDVVPAKLEHARALGATHTLDARQQDTVLALKELTGGRGVDFAIEAAGRPETMEAAIASIRPAGGTAVLAGNLPAGQTIRLNPFDLIAGKRVIGSWGGGSNPDVDVARFAALHQAGKMPLERLITHTYALEDINQALDDLEAGRVARALIANEGPHAPGA